jgi:hypothetical protein
MPPVFARALHGENIGPVVPDAASVSNARRSADRTSMPSLGRMHVGTPRPSAFRLANIIAHVPPPHQHKPPTTLRSACQPSPEAVGAQCRDEPPQSMGSRPYDQVSCLIPQDAQALGPPSRSEPADASTECGPWQAWARIVAAGVRTDAQDSRCRCHNQQAHHGHEPVETTGLTQPYRHCDDYRHRSSENVEPPARRHPNKRRKGGVGWRATTAGSLAVVNNHNP